VAVMSLQFSTAHTGLMNAHNQQMYEHVCRDLRRSKAECRARYPSRVRFTQPNTGIEAERNQNAAIVEK
jgi:hypothetical protein